MDTLNSTRQAVYPLKKNFTSFSLIVISFRGKYLCSYVYKTENDFYYYSYFFYFVTYLNLFPLVNATVVIVQPRDERLICTCVHIWKRRSLKSDVGGSKTRTGQGQLEVVNERGNRQCFTLTYHQAYIAQC